MEWRTTTGACERRDGLVAHTVCISKTRARRLDSAARWKVDRGRRATSRRLASGAPRRRRALQEARQKWNCPARAPGPAPSALSMAPPPIGRTKGTKRHERSEATRQGRMASAVHVSRTSRVLMDGWRRIPPRCRPEEHHPGRLAGADSTCQAGPSASHPSGGAPATAHEAPDRQLSLILRKCKPFRDAQSTSLLTRHRDSLAKLLYDMDTFNVDSWLTVALRVSPIEALIGQKPGHARKA